VDVLFPSRLKLSNGIIEIGSLIRSAWHILQTSHRLKKSTKRTVPLEGGTEPSMREKSGTNLSLDDDGTVLVELAFLGFHCTTTRLTVT
jgi:hypothetical protein